MRKRDEKTVIVFRKHSGLLGANRVNMGIPLRRPASLEERQDYA
jgi:hypothetical protein